MKKWESYWKRFEKTGDVRDYLNYTACTREDAAGEAEYAGVAGMQTGMTAPGYESVQTGEANPAAGAQRDYFAV